MSHSTGGSLITLIPAWWFVNAARVPHVQQPHCRTYQNMSEADPPIGVAELWMQSLVYSYQHWKTKITGWGSDIETYFTDT